MRNSRPFQGNLLINDDAVSKILFIEFIINVV